MADRQDDNFHQIRRDIEHTRAEMQETIEAIRGKLDPDHLKHQAQEAVREATIGRAEDAMNKAMGRAEDARSGIMDTVRQNPISAALAGIGLGWMLMNRSSSEKRDSSYYGRMQPYYGKQGGYYRDRVTGGTSDSGFPYQGSRSRIQGYDKPGEEGLLDQAAEKASQAREAAAEMMSEVRSRTGDLMGDTGEMVAERGSGLMDTIRANPIPAVVAGIGLGWLFMNGSSRPEHGYSPAYPGYGEEPGPMGGVRDKVGNTVDQAQGMVGDLAGRVQEAVGDVSDQVQHQAGSMARQTRHQYGRVEDSFQETLSSNPLAIGVVALAVGAVTAMMMPTTPQERRFMGEARDNLMDQVQSTAQDTMDKVQRVAKQVQDTAKTEAKAAGLTE